MTTYRKRPRRRRYTCRKHRGGNWQSHALKTAIGLTALGATGLAIHHQLKTRNENSNANTHPISNSANTLLISNSANTPLISNSANTFPIINVANIKYKRTNSAGTKMNTSRRHLNKIQAIAQHIVTNAKTYNMNKRTIANEIAHAIKQVSELANTTKTKTKIQNDIIKEISKYVNNNHINNNDINAIINDATKDDIRPVSM